MRLGEDRLGQAARGESLSLNLISLAGLHWVLEHEEDLEQRVGTLEAAYGLLTELLPQALGAQWGTQFKYAVRWGTADRELALTPSTPALGEQVATRLGELLDRVAEAADPYERLDAFTDLKDAVARAVTRARAAGARNLGRALFLLRDGLQQLRAEDIEQQQIDALATVVGMLREGEPSTQELIHIDEVLCEGGVDWVPMIAVQATDP